MKAGKKQEKRQEKRQLVWTVDQASGLLVAQNVNVIPENPRVRALGLCKTIRIPNETRRSKLL